MHCAYDGSGKRCAGQAMSGGDAQNLLGACVLYLSCVTCADWHRLDGYILFRSTPFAMVCMLEEGLLAYLLTCRLLNRN